VGFSLDVIVGEALSWREAQGADDGAVEREFRLTPACLSTSRNKCP
jgi:hypothetical protein